MDWSKITIFTIGFATTFYLLVAGVYLTAYRNNYYDSDCKKVKPLVKTIMCGVLLLGLISTLITVWLHGITNVTKFILLMLGVYYIIYCLSIFYVYCEIQPRYKFYNTVQRVDWYLNMITSWIIGIIIATVFFIGISGGNVGFRDGREDERDGREDGRGDGRGDERDRLV